MGTICNREPLLYVVGQKCSPHPKISVLNNWTCACYLIWKKGLCWCDYVKDFEMRRSSWNEVGSKCHQQVFLYEKREEDGVALWPQRQRLEWCTHKPRSTWRHQMDEKKKRFSSRASRVNVTLWAQCFLTLEVCIFVILSQPVWGHFLQQPQAMNTLPLSMSHMFLVTFSSFQKNVCPSCLYYKFFAVCTCINSCWV